MAKSRSQVLVFPRSLLPKREFTTWNSFGEQFALIAERCFWEERSFAEESQKLVQPIPSAIALRDGAVMMSLRSANTREDLRNRASIIFGGHVDVAEVPSESDRTSASMLAQLFVTVMRRELGEEIGVIPARARPVGVVVDHTSLRASRHAAFVWQVDLNRLPSVQAAEEFVVRGSGYQFAPAGNLNRWSGSMDPWSAILVRNLFSVKSEPERPN